MTQNIRRSQRTAHKKQNEDFIYAQNLDDAPRFSCKGCDNVFKKKKILLIHQAQCTSLKIILSKQTFFGDHFQQKQNESPAVEKEENLLPSQPLIGYNYRKDDDSPRSYADVVLSPTRSGNPTLAAPKQPQSGAAADESHSITPEISVPVEETEITDIVSVPDEEIDIEIKITEISVPVEEIVITENVKIYADLPNFVAVPGVPNKPYNCVSGLDFAENISKIYDSIITWKKNLFQVPSGQCGKDYIKLMSKWLQFYNEGTTFEGIALKVVMTLPNLMLQKPSATSKAKDHTKSLQQRLQMWNEGRFLDLWKDGQILQKKLIAKPQKSPADITRIFTNLIFEAKVGSALRFLDENASNAVMKPTKEVVEKLLSLHPEAAEILPDSLFQGPRQPVSPAHFDSITEQTILKAAKQTHGSGGPSLLDAKQWKRILCSNQFKAEGKDLREQLATFARKIATKIVDPSTLEAYCANRLIPLDKAPGEAELQVRPIGVSEVMRRIVGKTISWSLSTEIQTAAGPLQVSAGLKAGAEAAIHSMRETFELEATDAVILVDAENAFNRLNRFVALHNMQFICPPLATVLINTYRTPGRLLITSGGEIFSAEGTTQGDTLAMAFYGLGTRPILTRLKQSVPSVLQVWFADDATGAGKLGVLRQWWEEIQTEGIRFGYHVKPKKSWLILKDPARFDECSKIFESSPINITIAGKRHLGAAIGTTQFKDDYISEKVQRWTANIETLAKIAKSQPHAAYAAYIHGEQHKYTYFKRTLIDISDNLTQLDEAIDNLLIPTLFGCELNENERDIISLPVKKGGLGMRKVAENCEQSYKASVTITKPLTEEIKKQSDNLPSVEDVTTAKSKALAEMRQFESERAETIKAAQSPQMQRLLDQHSESGASSWLGALPVQSQGLNLTKGEFHDALCLRYQKNINNLPSLCPCGKEYNVTHAMNCKRGGFITARHNTIRDLECNLLKIVTPDVECEPMLQPVINKAGYKSSAILGDGARLDVRSRGFWRRGQNAFFDVRITNADCESQQDSSLKAVLQDHEAEKKRHYNRRVMEVEHGSFTPLVFTTTGVMSHECAVFHKSLAEKISLKRGDRYEEIMRYIRVKLSFLALKATLLCLRGSRSHTTSSKFNDDFGLSLNELRV